MAAAALVLIAGNAIAADDAGTTPAKPDAANSQATQSDPPPKEEATDSKAPDASKKEPE
jgi:hypothetical protein